MRPCHFRFTVSVLLLLYYPTVCTDTSTGCSTDSTSFGSVIEVCPICSDQHAGVRWNVSGRIFINVVRAECKTSADQTITIGEECNVRQGQLSGTFNINANNLSRYTNHSGYVSRVHIISRNLSRGDNCTFTVKHGILESTRTTVSCIIKDQDMCIKDPESCSEPLHCGDCSCTCASGYTADGFTNTWRDGHHCYDINECDTEGACHPNATCINTRGSYHCECTTGFTGDGENCTDVNECEDLCEDGNCTAVCHPNATCTNTIGAYSCECDPGFSGDGVNCTDIDECDAVRCHADAICNNTVGSYYCQCEEGFNGDGATCTDIIECEDEDACHSNAACTNTRGSYHCECTTGFTGDGENCTDVNECEDLCEDGHCTAACHPNATCTNKIGSYNCECDPGFSGDGVNCTASAQREGSVLVLVLSTVTPCIMLIIVAITCLYPCAVVCKCLANKRKSARKYKFWKSLGLGYTEKVDMEFAPIDVAPVNVAPVSENTSMSHSTSAGTVLECLVNGFENNVIQELDEEPQCEVSRNQVENTAVNRDPARMNSFHTSHSIVNSHPGYIPNSGIPIPAVCGMSTALNSTDLFHCNAISVNLWDLELDGSPDGHMTSFRPLTGSRLNSA